VRKRLNMPGASSGIIAWLLYVTRWVGQRRFLSAGLLGFDGSLLGCL